MPRRIQQPSTARRCLHVCLERAQVAVIDANDVCAERHGAFGLVLIVDFDERGEAQRIGQIEEGVQLCIVECSHDEQNCVCAGSVCFIHLIVVHDEVFTQRRSGDGIAHLLQVIEVTLEVSVVSQHADRGCAVVDIGSSDGGRVPVVRHENAARR